METQFLVKYFEHDGDEQSLIFAHRVDVQKYCDGLREEGLTYRAYEKSQFGSWVMLSL